jgi:hypothetical protein
MLGGSEFLVERVLPTLGEHVVHKMAVNPVRLTIDIMTTHGKFNFRTIACERVDLPEPELPAMPIMLTSAHGGE